eukprot:SAG31_NODE_6194_length_2128_cov_1.769345_2_plen_245_part_01
MKQHRLHRIRLHVTSAPIVGESLGAPLVSATTATAGPVKMTGVQLERPHGPAGPTARGLKTWGHLELPDPSIMASSLIPICVVHGPAAPKDQLCHERRVLLLAGNHGNEYEGQIVLRRLAQAIDPSTVRGQLIIIPTLSMEASRAWTREWPDGINFNRTMPGSPNGSPAEQLAFFLSKVLIPTCDVVFDLHTGGHNMRIDPSTMCFALSADNKRHREEAEAQLAMLAPLMMLARQPPLKEGAGGG